MPEVEVRQLPIECIHALAAGDLTAAQRQVPYALAPVLASPEWRHTWQRRSNQLHRDPTQAQWVTGVIWDLSEGLVVGKAGFHEPPNVDGVVEVGYQVMPQYQRQGYGHATMAWLLARAYEEPKVRRIRACVAAHNTPSLRIVAEAGLQQVGTEWDADDQQWELVFERELTPHPS